jgi:uncharacterized membrane protein YgaE (UPF0421/DUF939 family)
VTAVLHAVKAALAAVLAWLLADGLLHLPQPFLAPYAAAFLIESTVYRSLRSSAQQVAAVPTAVLLVFAVQRLAPSMPLAVGITVLSGLLIGKLRFYGDAGVWVALTAVVVLTTDNPDTLLVDRLVETALGALIGTAVNALVIPPRYRKWPAQPRTTPRCRCTGRCTSWPWAFAMANSTRTRPIRSTPPSRWRARPRRLSSGVSKPSG